MKGLFKEIGYVLEDRLKRITGEITPDKKLCVILIVLLICTLANLYITFRAVQGLGKDRSKENTMNIGHIEQPDIIKPGGILSTDSLKGGYYEKNFFE